MVYDDELKIFAKNISEIIKIELIDKNNVEGYMNIYRKIIILIMIYARTAHNRIVNASPPFGGSGCVRLGRSLRSLPRLTPPQFASPGFAPQALIRAGKPSFTTGNVKRNLG
jgi:hypothetical protein